MMLVRRRAFTKQEVEDLIGDEDAIRHLLTEFGFDLSRPYIRYMAYGPYDIVIYEQEILESIHEMGRHNEPHGSGSHEATDQGAGAQGDQGTTQAEHLDAGGAGLPPGQS